MNKRVFVGGWILALWASAIVAAEPSRFPSPGDFHLTRIETPTLAGEIPLYEGDDAPSARGVPERWGTLEIGSYTQRVVRNVWKPTLTPVVPDTASSNGAAIIVAPGGGFMSLSMDSEGFAVARRLAASGITAFVLKYRLEQTPDDEQAFLAALGARFGEAIKNPGKVPMPAAVVADATADALRALTLVRKDAARWRVDPARVGMIGFSAGAMTSLQAALAPTVGERPAFFGYIYGPMTAIAVPADAPPCFVAFALDDPLFGQSGFGFVESWRRAGRPIEMHAYERGDHGFGLGKPGTTSTLMADEFVAWLGSRGLLGATAH